MREPTIARNYAETLVALAKKANDLEGWGTMIAELADAVERDPRLLRFLQSPRIDAARKNEIIAAAFQDRLPRVFVRFIQAVINHRRQSLFPQIAREYQTLVDQEVGRVHASVMVAREPDAETQGTIARRLSETIGKSVVPHYQVNPSILGGVVVRIGDLVMDGSVRRRLAVLKARMLRGAAV